MIKTIVSIDTEAGKDKGSAVCVVPYLCEIKVIVGVLMIGAQGFIPDDDLSL